MTTTTTTKTEKSGLIPAPFLMIICVAGIYSSFLYYGTLQEDVFHFKNEKGEKFTQAWLLQVLEAFANVLFGFLGLVITGGFPLKNIPFLWFGLSGASQVVAKAMTSLALAKGVSFPLVTLAKSAKMAPVMIGSLLIGGAKYTLKDYLIVLSIIGGTTLVSLGKKSGPASSTAGLICVALSLACDGFTGGAQTRLKAQAKKISGKSLGPMDMMAWSNFFMMLVAIAIAFAQGELFEGIEYIKNSPQLLEKIVRFSLCSAFGQLFIFVTIAKFDPLICTTVTTTRKVFSVLLSIFLNGHAVSTQGWVGIGLASAAILAEISGGKKHGHSEEEKKKK